MKSARGWAAFGAGLVFAIGLGISGMTRPSKVLGFLDVTGDWDPSLALVMGAALAIGFALTPWILRRQHPLLDDGYHVPRKAPIDARLITGAALFGVGWGIGGFCPGPALVTAATGAGSAVVFTLAMLAGMSAFAGLTRFANRETHASRPREDG